MKNAIPSIKWQQIRMDWNIDVTSNWIHRSLLAYFDWNDALNESKKVRKQRVNHIFNIWWIYLCFALQKWFLFRKMFYFILFIQWMTHTRPFEPFWFVSMKSVAVHYTHLFIMTWTIFDQMHPFNSMMNIENSTFNTNSIHKISIISFDI